MSELPFILQCENVCKSFIQSSHNVSVLNKVNLQLARAEMIAITGASGSGKSTLLHVLGGLDKPSSGEVSLLGKKLGTLSENAKAKLRNRSLGFVYQFHHLLPEFSALENVCMPLWLRGEKVGKTRTMALDMLKEVGLLRRAEHGVGQLSGGERQRVAIARALVTQPACVLADEPTGNLDTETAEQVFDVMLRLNRERGTSFILVTHSLALAGRLDKCYQLTKGTLNAFTRV